MTTACNFHRDLQWNSQFGYDHEEYSFNCPGCGHGTIHRIVVKWGTQSRRTKPTWQFNNNLDSPSFTPELEFNGPTRHFNPTTQTWSESSNSDPANGIFRCVSTLENGVLTFSELSEHGLAGKWVRI